LSQLLGVGADRLAKWHGELRKVEQSDVPRPQVRLHPLGIGESRDLPTNDDAIVAREDSENAIGVALDEVGHVPESPRARSSVNSGLTDIHLLCWPETKLRPKVSASRSS